MGRRQVHSPMRQGTVPAGPTAGGSRSTAVAPSTAWHREPTREELIALQRSIGNRAVTGLLATVQRAPRQPDPAPAGGPARGGAPEPSGLATAENVRPLIEGRLATWEAQALLGIQKLKDEELTKRIALLEAGSLDPWLKSLVGNVMWAAACFLGASPWGAFVLSLAGIGVAAGATTPSSPGSGKAPIDVVADKMTEYLQTTHYKLVSHVPAAVHELLQRFDEDLTIDGALAIMLTEMFPPKMLLPNTAGLLTEISEGAVTRRQHDYARKKLDAFIDQVVNFAAPPNIMHGEFQRVLFRVAGVGLGEGYFDSLSSRSVVIERWVDNENRAAVLEVARKRFQRVVEVEPEDLKKIPD
jgi:hypothetical protein